MPPQPSQASGKLKLPTVDISTLSIDELEKLETKVKNRKITGRVLAVLTGFFDGAFDLAAILSIGGFITTAVVGSALLVLFPPIGMAILGGLLGACALTGIMGAIKGYIDEVAAYDNELLAIQAVIGLKEEVARKTSASNKPVPDLDAEWETLYLKYQNDIEQEFAGNEVAKLLALDALERVKAEKERRFKIFFSQSQLTQVSNDPDIIPSQVMNPDGTYPSDETFAILDKTDLWSRRARNAFGLSFLTTNASFLAAQGIAYVFNPAVLILTLGLAAFQLITWLVKDRWIDKPRAENNKLISRVKEAEEIKLKFLSEMDELAEEIKFKARLAQQPSYALVEREKLEVKSADTLSLYSDAGVTFTPDPTSLYTQLTAENGSAAKRQTPGVILAGVLGFSHGALHTVAWLFIAALIASAFIAPPIGIPLLVVTGIMACITGGVLAWRSIIKEREIQQREKDEFDKVLRAAKRCEMYTQRSPVYSNANKLDGIFQKLNGEIPDDYLKKDKLSCRLKEKYDDCKERYTKLVEQSQINRESFKKPLTYTSSTSAVLYEKFLGSEQPPLQRRIRDFFSVAEKPLAAYANFKDVAVDVALVVLTCGLALIPIVISFVKTQEIDSRRLSNINKCNQMEQTLDTKLAEYKRDESSLELQRKQLEESFEREVNVLLRGIRSTTRPSISRSASTTSSLPPLYKSTETSAGSSAAGSANGTPPHIARTPEETYATLTDAAAALGQRPPSGRSRSASIGSHPASATASPRNALGATAVAEHLDEEDTLDINVPAITGNFVQKQLNLNGHPTLAAIAPAHFFEASSLPT